MAVPVERNPLVLGKAADDAGRPWSGKSRGKAVQGKPVAAHAGNVPEPLCRMTPWEAGAGASFWVMVGHPVLVKRELKSNADPSPTCETYHFHY